SYRHMNGYGSHTYLWINATGEKHWVKYHFHSEQGVESLTDADASKIAGEDADFHRRDLYESIDKGDFPSWTLSIQAMPYEDAKTYRFNPFDLTKVWPHADYPLIEVGTMTLNKNPDNFFAQIEQAAFEPSATVPGIGFSPDKMLLGRAFAYADTHRYRIGPNYLQLPVNRPKVEVNTYTQDGPMAYEHRADAPVYAPNSFGRGYADEVGEVNDGWETDGAMVRQAYTLREDDDDFSQAGALVREVWNDEQREMFVQTVSGHLLGGVKGDVLERAFQYWMSVDPDTGKRIEELVRTQSEGDAPGAQPEAAKAEAADAFREPVTNANN
ncbi:MAG: catalase, partial [Nocardioides sp.]